MRRLYNNLGDLLSTPAPFKFECPFAIKFGTTLHTRCMRRMNGHGEMHEGRGLEQFPYQTLKWHGGDQREYRVDDPDSNDPSNTTIDWEKDRFYAWEE